MKPIVVQLLRVINIGVPQNAGGAEEEGSDSEAENQEDDNTEKFENKYLEACDQVAINQQRDDAMKAKNKQASGNNRMFKYLFTDGRTQIIALYSIQLERTQPGSKILLIGPIEVRRGIWLLKQNNIKMLWENSSLPKMVPKLGFAEAN